MYYNIKNCLGTTALALVLAMSTTQAGYAQLSNDSDVLPNEISLNESPDGGDLLLPPTLEAGDVEPQADGGSDGEALDTETASDAIPLSSGAEDTSAPALTNDGQDLDLPMQAPLSAAQDNEFSQHTGSQEAQAEASQPVANFPSFAKQVSVTPESSNFGENILAEVDNDLFNQMSDIEKQTSLLSLELRREKIKNEIAAIQAARLEAQEELAEKKAEKKRKKIEWEKEQERKLLIEEQKLKKLNLIYEKLRQETIVKAYKEKMLTTNQQWIENTEVLYAELIKAEKERDKLVKNLKNKLNHVAQLSMRAADSAERAKQSHTREIANLQTQISILKSRLETERLAREEVNFSQEGKMNPFASASEKFSDKEVNQKLSDEYAIMEITGKGDDLAAKIINKSGATFMVRKGTVLQSGHQVNEITKTFLRASKDSEYDYLYFAAGGVLDREPLKAPTALMSMTPLPTANAQERASSSSGLSVSQALPSLRSGMFVR